MSKLIQNLKHLPSTLPGLLLGATALLNSETVQAAANVNPKLAHYVGVGLGVVAGLSYVFGVGKPK